MTSWTLVMCLLAVGLAGCRFGSDDTVTRRRRADVYSNCCLGDASKLTLVASFLFPSEKADCWKGTTVDGRLESGREDFWIGAYLDTGCGDDHEYLVEFYCDAPINPHYCREGNCVSEDAIVPSCYMPEPGTVYNCSDITTSETLCQARLEEFD